MTRNRPIHALVPILLSITLIAPAITVASFVGVTTPVQPLEPAAREPTTTMTWTFSFDRPVLVPNPIVPTYDIEIDGLPSHGSPTEPSLPFKPVTVALPQDTMVEDVIVQVGKEGQIDLDRPVTPVPTQEGSCSGSVTASDLRMGDAYLYGRGFPELPMTWDTSFGLTRWEQDDDAYIRLSDEVRSNFVDIKLFPARYDPSQDVLTYYGSMEVELHLGHTDIGPPGHRAPDYDMVIITPQAFASTYQALADHHNDTGIVTTVVSKEDVLGGRFFPVNGSTDFARIKHFIKDAVETWNITYVTLGGDSGQIPPIQAKVVWPFTTDLYYADIYKPGGAYADWNADGDAEYGEFTDDMSNIDIRPDVHLGRLPSSSVAQASTMVEKVRYYDNNTAGADWFKQLTVLTTMSEGREYGDYLADEIYTTDNGFEHIKLYNEKATAENLSAPENHSVGYMAFWGHGGTGSWLGGDTIQNSDINAMTNFQKLPIVSIMACECGHFDAGTDCFAETFFKSPNGGGISVLAGTQTSNAEDMYSWAGATNKNFHDSNLGHDLGRQGQMYSRGVDLFVEEQNPRGSSLDYKNLVQYVFFGDPAATIGGYSSTTATMTSAATEGSALPGQNTTYLVNVQNTGGQWTELFLDTDLLEESEWGVELTRAHLTLGPGASGDVGVNVTVPQGADANDTLELRLNATSIHIPVSPLSVTLTTLALTNYSFGFDIAQNETKIEALGTASYDLSVSNTGNDPFTFGLEPVDPPSGWDVSFSEEVATLPRDQVWTPTLELTPGPNVTAGSYHMMVRCTLGGPDMVIDRWLNTTVGQAHGFDMVFEGLNATVGKGEAAHYNFTITNIGNHMDEVQYSFLNGADLPGWTLELPNDGLVVMDAFSCKDDGVTVVSTNDTLAGDYTLKFKAVLASDGSSKEFELVTTIIPEHSFEVTSDVPVQQGEATDIFAFELRVTNNGNAADGYELTAPGLGTEWAVEMVSLVNVPAYSFAPVPLEVSADPVLVLGGLHNITVEVMSSATGQVETLVLGIDIKRTYGVKVTADREEATVDQGGKATFVISIGNLGNSFDSYTVSSSGLTGWSTAIDDGSPGVDPRQTLNVTIEATAPAHVLAGTYTLTVDVLSTAGPGVSGKLELKVTVNRVVALDIVLLGMDGEVEVEQGETIQLQFLIENLGNGDDTVHYGFPGWPRDLRTDLDNGTDLGPGQNRTGALSITAFKNCKADRYTLTMTARSATDDSDQDSETFVLVVKKRAADGDDGMGMDMTMLGAIIGIIVLVIVILLVMVMMRMRGGKGPAPDMSVEAPPEEAPGPKAEGESEAGSEARTEAGTEAEGPEVVEQ